MAHNSTGFAYCSSSRIMCHASLSSALYCELVGSCSLRLDQIWVCVRYFCWLVLLLLFFLIIYLFIYGWVFVSVRGLSLVAASGGHSSSRCAGLSLSRPLLLRSTGSRRAGSANVALGPSCSAARGIFPDQGSNPCPLHWQADSQPLRHQGSPVDWFYM